MLKLLHIENIAIIEKCDIEFGTGFNVLTGETGAGKSIIIDAISAVLGQRSSRSLVRSGADRAFVSALFETTENAELWLREQGFEVEGELLLQREITPDGKTTCRVNGKPISVGLLKSLGDTLLNIHGQHDSQSLLDTEHHAEYIDRFAEKETYEAIFARYESEYNRFLDLTRELKVLSMSEQEYVRRVDMLRYQIEELEGANLKAGEYDELIERRTMLRNAAKITESLNLVASLFTGDDERAGIISDLGGAERALYGLKLSDTDDITARVGELLANAQDVSQDVNEILRKIDASPEEIERVEDRCDFLKRLTVKYGGSEEELIAQLNSFKDELATIEHSDERKCEVEKLLDECENECWDLAQKLFNLRRRTARDFERRVMSELSDLDMSKVTFVAEISPCENLGVRGADTIEFLISTNLGEPLKPLAKIASGGEMARIMLALKNVLAENDKVQTLIFDEVDAGVSGRAAQKVAEKLAKLSGKKQILCVTHLPQMSAMADTHFKIEKEEVGGRTVTNVTIMDDSGRILELARLLGGADITETTKNNARELIETAKKIKKEQNK
ncbi:MAG: DNA repair protein RecN [Clostridia bacterium]|nr:DNA repair protein RecN [Clostridia bacterium]